MLIGLVGAHRVGKTTLAKVAAEALGIPYVPTSATSTFARLGLTARDQFTFPQRLEVQREVLKDAEIAWTAGAHSIGISDRTPVDMMAYTMADVGPYTLDAHPGSETLLKGYVEDCKNAVRRHFKGLMVIRPGIPVVDDPTKASPCPYYIAHLDRMMAGMVLDRDLRCEVLVLRAEVTEMGDRIRHTTNMLETLVKNHCLLDKGERLH